MKALRIEGGRPLVGTIAVSGSKNATLPMMAAALLTPEPVELVGVPELVDVDSMQRLLALLGVTVERAPGELRLVAADRPAELRAPYELVRTFRASILVLGPLLVRWGEAVVSLPGGCAIGARPVDQHLKGLRRLGAEIEVREGYVHARARRGLRGARVLFDVPTVGGTENLLMAAALARGETILENAACEPEIVALAELLVAMGARIEGAGTPVVRIEGVDELGGARMRVIPDRVEAGTYLLAAAATRGEVTLTGVAPHHLDALFDKLAAVGFPLEVGADQVSIGSPEGAPRPADVVTAPYPGFPTDLQAQWMSLMLTVPGVAEIEERIFENRFMHVAELQRMGAQIRVHGGRAIVTGGRPLYGAPVMATDLRASAGLVIAGLAAEGTTEVLRIYHLERGYERLAEKLAALGASVALVERDATVPRLEAGTS